MEEYREEKKAAGNRFRETEREGGSIFLFNTGPSLKRTVHVFDEPRTKGGWLLDSGDRGRLSRLASVTAWGQQVGRQAGRAGRCGKVWPVPTTKQGGPISTRERDPYLFRRARAPDQARMEMAPSTIFRYVLVSQLSKMKIYNRSNSQNK